MNIKTDTGAALNEDLHSRRQDADANEAVLQKALDERNFIKSDLPGLVHSMCSNCSSFDEIQEWLKIEFEDIRADLAHDRSEDEE